MQFNKRDKSRGILAHASDWSVMRLFTAKHNLIIADDKTHNV